MGAVGGSQTTRSQTPCGCVDSRSSHPTHSLVIDKPRAVDSRHGTQRERRTFGAEVGYASDTCGMEGSGGGVGQGRGRGVWRHAEMDGGRRMVRLPVF